MRQDNSMACCGPQTMYLKQRSAIISICYVIFYLQYSIYCVWGKTTPRPPADHRQCVWCWEVLLYQYVTLFSTYSIYCVWGKTTPWPAADHRQCIWSREVLLYLYVTLFSTYSIAFIVYEARQLHGLQWTTDNVFDAEKCYYIYMLRYFLLTV